MTLDQENKPALAQDEREAVERFSPTTSVPHCGRASEVEAYMTEDDDGEYMTVSQHERIVAALSAQQSAPERVSAFNAGLGVFAMILQALDRDAAEGKAVRGEMAAELRALLASHQRGEA